MVVVVVGCCFFFFMSSCVLLWKNGKKMMVGKDQDQEDHKRARPSKTKGKDERTSGDWGPRSSPWSLVLSFFFYF